MKILFKCDCKNFNVKIKNCSQLDIKHGIYLMSKKFFILIKKTLKNNKKIIIDFLLTSDEKFKEITSFNNLSCKDILTFVSVIFKKIIQSEVTINLDYAKKNNMFYMLIAHGFTHSLLKNHISDKENISFTKFENLLIKSVSCNLI